MMGRDIAGPGNQFSRLKEKKLALISLHKKDLKLFGVVEKMLFLNDLLNKSHCSVVSIHMEPEQNSSPSSKPQAGRTA